MLLRIPALKPLEVKGRSAPAAAASPAQLLTSRFQHNAFRFGRLLCKWTFLSNASWCTLLFWLLLKSVQKASKQTNASCLFFWQNLCFCSAWSEMESLDWCLCHIRDFKAWRDPGSNSCTQHTPQGLRWFLHQTQSYVFSEENRVWFEDLQLWKPYYHPS